MLAKLDDKSRSVIISAYGKALQNRPYSCGKESDLPVRKKLIRQALAEELLMGNLDEKERNALEAGFSELESFISDKEFESIKTHEDTMHKALEMMKKDPSNPRKLARILHEHPFPKDT